MLFLRLTIICFRFVANAFLLSDSSDNDNYINRNVYFLIVAWCTSFSESYKYIIEFNRVCIRFKIFADSCIWFDTCYIRQKTFFHFHYFQSLYPASLVMASFYSFDGLYNGVELSQVLTVYLPQFSVSFSHCFKFPTDWN